MNNHEDLVDFGNEDSSVFLDEHIKVVVAFKDQLTPLQIVSLMPLMAVLPYAEESQEEYGADFDVAGEVNQQIIAVRAMRKSIMTNGKINNNTPTREVKEVIAASTTMLSSLMKFHKEVINIDRMRAIEKATVKVMQDKGLSKEFLEALELELIAVEGK